MSRRLAASALDRSGIAGAWQRLRPPVGVILMCHSVGEAPGWTRVPVPLISTAHRISSTSIWLVRGALRKEFPDLQILTCHDEYLLPTLVEGADGALIGFAGFTPELMVEVVHAALELDLPLNVHSRSELIRYAVRKGILQIEREGE